MSRTGTDSSGRGREEEPQSRRRPRSGETEGRPRGRGGKARRLGLATAGQPGGAARGTPPAGSGVGHAGLASEPGGIAKARSERRSHGRRGRLGRVEKQKDVCSLAGRSERGPTDGAGVLRKQRCVLGGHLHGSIVSLLIKQETVSYPLGNGSVTSEARRMWS